MEKAKLVRVSIPSAKLRLFLREWLGYIVVTEEELNTIMGQILSQVAFQDNYVLSNPQIHEEILTHTISFVAKGENERESFHLEAIFNEEGENTLKVKSEKEEKEYTLKEDFYLAPKVKEKESFCDIYTKEKENFCEFLIREEGEEIKIAISPLNKRKIHHLIDLKGIEESLRNDSLWNISLENILDDIFDNSFGKEEFNSLRIVIAISNSEEKFEALIYKGILCNVRTVFNNQEGYHFVQCEKNAVPWNFKDIEFYGVGTQIKPAMKTLERIKKRK